MEVNDERIADFFNSEATNCLITIGRKDLKINQDTKTAKIEKGGLIVEFEKFEIGKNAVRTSMWKLLYLLMIEFTNNNIFKGKNVDLFVTIPLEEAARKLGYNLDIPVGLSEEERVIATKKVKNTLDNARRTIAKDLELLYKMSLSWRSYKKKRKVDDDFSDIRILPEARIKNGKINVAFGPSIGLHLVNSYIGKYQLNVLKTSGNNPLAFQLGTRLVIHQNINAINKTSTGDKLRIISIVEGLGELPSYQELKDKTHWKRYIKNPIENSLEQLQKLKVVKEWEYQDKKGEAMSPEEVEQLNYLEFEKVYLHFELYQ